MIDFEIHGLPVPQGSARAFVVKGHAVITSANKGLKSWRRLVAETAREYAPPVRWDGPVGVTLAFRLPQPPSRPTTAGRGHRKRVLRIWPDRRPDLDKLVRGILDGLTGVIFADDSQVVAIQATKDYGVPGVTVQVWQLNLAITLEPMLERLVQRAFSSMQ